MKNIVVFALILISSILHSQTFTDISAGLDGDIYCSVAWGDYDNDGDLDILLSGRLYRNDSGVFTYVDSGMTVPNYCSVDWGDYDNDGDLDIAICGLSASSITKIYRNDNGVFSDIAAGITGVYIGSVNWGDYDSDGDLDILLTGYSSYPISRIYRNDNGIFTDINAGLTGVYHSSADWGDYDNDGDLDIVLCGKLNTYDPVSIIYRNDNGIFTDINAGLQDIDECSVAWGDYDSDGDLDILLSGERRDGYTCTKIYSNDNGIFTDINAGLLQCDESSVAWGDYDNDGDLDILLSGYNSGYNTRIYGNNNGNFTDINAGLTGIYEGSVAWGDYDNDGDLDILISGSQISKVYRNNEVISNTVPNSPSNLSSLNSGNDVVLSWNKATDNETLQDALTYNIYIGTENMNTDRLNPMSDISNGKRKIVSIGNSGHNTVKTAKNLASGTYYWSVQSIDNSFAGSAFSTEQSFVHTAPLTIAPIANEVTNCSTASFTANWTETGWVWGYYLDVAADENFQNFIGGYENKNVGNVLSFEVIGLSPETHYYYRVKSYNLDYTPSENSNVITIKTPNTFTEIPSGIQTSGVISWGDYDNDGDLDVLTNEAKIYRNDSGSFTLVNIGIDDEIYNSSSSWGDYDNDGDLDIVISGDNGSGRISKIYRNNEGLFSDINAGLLSLENSSTGWGDYDNDGDLDLVLTGRDYDVTAYYVSKIYRNDQGVFFDINAGLMGVEDGWSSWGDYDNDGDLDLIITGSYYSYSKGNICISKIYRNDAGIFTDINADLAGVEYSCVAWGDYDNDGDLDIILTGRNQNYDNISKLYRNDSGIFIDINADLIGGTGSVAWGDYDNDGDLDLLLNSVLYNNNFGLFSNVNTGFEGYGSFGDYDNDGDLDILLSGYHSGYYSNIYRNECSVVNNLPESPTNLQTQIADNTVEFSWSKSLDIETPQDGLSYNIYIGTVSNTSDRLSPMSNISTGYRKVVELGNTGLNNTYIIKNLPSGPLYWSVQAIDNSYSGSSFSPEQIIEYTSPISDPPVALPATEIYIHSFAANWTQVDQAIGYYLDVAMDSLFTEYVPGYENKDINNVLRYEVTGLVDNEAYYYRLRSYNSDYIESGNSNIISANTPFKYFYKVTTNLPGIRYSSVDWGDYDNDGDLDLLMSGSDSTNTKITKIYRNDSGIFSDIDAGLTGVIGGAVKWGDYDNDGDLDIIITGTNISKIYRNDSGIFTDIDTGLTGIYNGSVSWGDYDNDGDLDMLLNSMIYRNDSGIFTEIEPGFEEFSILSSSWSDYDVDGDLDVLLIGKIDYFDPITSTWYSYPVSKLYSNDSGVFTEILSGGFNYVYSCSVDWGDFDNDGDLDIITSGRTENYQNLTNIYRNDSGSFTNINAGLANISGDVSWGDYDNDGDLDAVINGWIEDEGNFTKIYRNDSVTFNDINSLLTGVLGSVSWIDYDNDGDLDLFQTGDSGSKYVTELYRNNSLISNNAPNSPSNLSSSIDTDEITLTWDKATDNETPQDGLSYNLYVGSASQNPDKMTPMSDISNGFRKIVNIGNAGHANSWSIKNLPSGTYYWSVQSIDNCFAGSNFASEQTFTVTGIEGDNLPFVTELYQNYPNPFNPETVIKYSLAKDAQVELKIFDIKGREVSTLINKKISRGYHSINFNGDLLSSGMYFYQLKVDEKQIDIRKMMMVK